jgi:TfoX/Sxy family transcriptional regulator of competence genes
LSVNSGNLTYFSGKIPQSGLFGYEGIFRKKMVAGNHAAGVHYFKNTSSQLSVLLG